MRLGCGNYARINFCLVQEDITIFVQVLSFAVKVVRLTTKPSSAVIMIFYSILIIVLQNIQFHRYITTHYLRTIETFEVGMQTLIC